MGGGTTMLPDDLPEDMPSFLARFGSDEQCREYLFEARWPDGFRCSACGHDDAYALRTKIVDECVACRKQHSLLAGTIFEQTKTGLAKWTASRGVEGWDQNITRPRACRSLPCRPAPRPGCGSPRPSANAAGCRRSRHIRTPPPGPPHGCGNGCGGHAPS